jgi:hypothetical protein
MEARTRWESRPSRRRPDLARALISEFMICSFRGGRFQVSSLTSPWT